MQYPENKGLSITEGKIIEFKNDNTIIIHSVSTDKCSSESSIILSYRNYNIIGINLGKFQDYNKGVYFKNVFEYPILYIPLFLLGSVVFLFIIVDIFPFTVSIPKLKCVISIRTKSSKPTFFYIIYFCSLNCCTIYYCFIWFIVLFNSFPLK